MFSQVPLLFLFWDVFWKIQHILFSIMSPLLAETFDALLIKNIISCGCHGEIVDTDDAEMIKIIGLWSLDNYVVFPESILLTREGDLL